MKLSILLILALSGCQLVTPQIVTTRVEKTKNGFTINSPKDIDIFFYQATDGSIIASYQSKVNVVAIKAGAAESQARSAAVARLAEAAASLR